MPAAPAAAAAATARSGRRGAAASRRRCRGTCCCCCCGGCCRGCCWERRCRDAATRGAAGQGAREARRSGQQAAAAAATVVLPAAIRDRLACKNKHIPQVPITCDLRLRTRAGRGSWARAHCWLAGLPQHRRSHCALHAATVRNQAHRRPFGEAQERGQRASARRDLRAHENSGYGIDVRCSDPPQWKRFPQRR